MSVARNIEAPEGSPGVALPGIRLPRILGPFQALGVVVGGTIGASIFLIPSIVAQRVPFLAGALFVWIAAAAITLTAVLTISELAAMLPQAGGGYVYIRTALGPFFGFLFAWTDAVMVRPGAAATVSFAFGIYVAQVLPPPASVPLPLWQGGIAIALLAVLVALNVRGAKLGAGLQLAGTVLKALALASALLLPIFLWHGVNGLVSAPFWPPLQTFTTTSLIATIVSAVVSAMIPVMWAYGGWDQLTHLAEEVRDPGKNLPRILTVGLFIIAALYLAVVLGMHYVLPYRQVAGSAAIGADLFRVLFGAPGVTFISIVVLFSTVIAANGAIMSGPRTAFALARDGEAPAWFAHVHPRFQTPANAIVALGFWSALLIVVSVTLMLLAPPPHLPAVAHRAWLSLQHQPLFAVLISYVMFGYLLLQPLLAVSLFVLRRTHPDWPRPFRVPGYPLVPALSIAATLFLLLAMAQTGSAEVLAGIAIVLTGLPVRWLYSRRKQ